MSKTKVKVTVKTGRKGDAGTLVARIPVAVVKTKQPRGELVYRTRAQIHTRIYTNSSGRPRRY